MARLALSGEKDSWRDLALLLVGVAVGASVLLAATTVHPTASHGLERLRLRLSTSAVAEAPAGASDAAPAAPQGDQYAARDALLASWPADRPKAAFVVVARSEDVDSMVDTMRQLAARWQAGAGSRDAYPWVFLNNGAQDRCTSWLDRRPHPPVPAAGQRCRLPPASPIPAGPLDDNFKHKVGNATCAPTFFLEIPKEHWGTYPEWIDQVRARSWLRWKAARGGRPLAGAPALLHLPTPPSHATDRSAPPSTAARPAHQRATSRATSELSAAAAVLAVRCCPAAPPVAAFRAGLVQLRGHPPCRPARSAPPPQFHVPLLLRLLLPAPVPGSL